MGFMRKRRRGISLRRYRLNKRESSPNPPKNLGAGLALFLLVIALVLIFSRSHQPKIIGDKSVGEMSATEYASYLQETAEGATLRFKDPVEKARYLRESKYVMDELRGAKYRLNSISSNEPIRDSIEKYKQALEEAKQFNRDYQSKLTPSNHAP